MSASIPVGGTLKIDNADDKEQLLDFLVDKRMKFFEYLRQIHSADPEVGVLWMNIVRIKRSDLLNYFNVDLGFVNIACDQKKRAKKATNAPASKNAKSAGAGNAVTSSSSAVFRATSESTPAAPSLSSNAGPSSQYPTGAQSGGGGGALSFTEAAAKEVLESRGIATYTPTAAVGSSSPSASSPPTTIIPPPTYEMTNLSEVAMDPPQAKVDPAFIRDHMLYWALLGASVASMLQAPKLFPGEVFVEAFIQLLMEIEIYTEKSGSASKMLAMRSLKNYRADNPSFWNDTEETVVDALPPQPTSQGFNKVLSPWRNCGPQTSQIFFERQCCRCADKSDVSGYLKYHFLDLHLASMLSTQSPPAYEAIVPALCGVLSMAYQRFSDYDTTLKQGVAKKIIAIDKKLKHFFFGALSREIAVLAQAKVVQQANFLSLKVFASFVHADEKLFLTSNFAPIEKDEDDESIAESVTGDSTAEGGSSKKGGKKTAAKAEKKDSNITLPPPSVAENTPKNGAYDAFDYD